MFPSSYLSLRRPLQLYVNEALLNVSDVDTIKGVIHGLTSVLEIRLNRCDKERVRIAMVHAIPHKVPPLHCDSEHSVESRLVFLELFRM